MIRLFEHKLKLYTSEATEALKNHKNISEEEEKKKKEDKEEIKWQVNQQ